MTRRFSPCVGRAVEIPARGDPQHPVATLVLATGQRQGAKAGALALTKVPQANAAITLKSRWLDDEFRNHTPLRATRGVQMTTKAVSRFMLAAGLVLTARVSQAQPKLEAFADIVAGSGESFSSNCGSVGPTAQLSFFTFRPQLVKPGGFVACGYAQSSLLTNTQNGGVGPLSNSNALSGVPLGGPLGPPGGIFDGTANSTASYGSLGASAHANVNSATGLPNNGAAMFETVGAATFSDWITATSPLVPSLSKAA